MKNEDFFNRYKTIGTIIQDKDGYNILNDKHEKMLNKSYSSLKRMLMDIASNL